MSNSEESTGLTDDSEQLWVSNRELTAAAARNQPGAAWITDVAVADTIRVWSPHYGRTITEAEAVEIQMNVVALAEALIQAERNRS